MRIGLIARCEIARGLAIQSRNFYDNMPVDRVLLVVVPRPDCATAPEWYPTGTVVASYDPVRHELNEQTVREWLRGLDVVFTVETPYDWRVPLWCKELGVKLIIQGNPEFVRHMDDPSLPHPDAWWWPTSWRLDELPPGKVMKVPMHTPLQRPVNADSKLRLVHVVGKRAYADRNGTDVLPQVVRALQSDVKLTIYGIDGQLPEFRRMRNVELELHPNGVNYKWEMYQDQDVLVMPRRYGGLCLPALEAAACDLVVMMPHIDANQELAAVTVGGGRRRPLKLACGTIAMVDPDYGKWAEAIDMLAQDRALLAEQQRVQYALLPTWTVWRQRYLDEMESLL